MKRLFVMSFMVLVGVNAFAGDVTYSLGSENDLLDASYYDGGARAAWWGSANNAGTMIAFHGVDYPAFTTEIYLVTLGNPSDWTQLTTGFANNPQEAIWWTPDDSALLIGGRIIDIATGTISPNIGAALGGAPDASITAKASNNWIVIRTDFYTPGVQNLVALPVLTDGTEDTSRGPVAITNFSPGELSYNMDWPAVAADGSVVAFVDNENSVTMGVPDIGEIYLLRNVGSILSAPKLMGTEISSAAPTSLTAPDVVEIRTSETINYAHTPALSQDKSLVFWSEDWNNVFRNNDFFNSIAAGDFDVMVTNSDGATTDFRIERLENQAVPTPTRGGTRMLYSRSVTSGAMAGFENINFHLFITTLEISEDLTTESTAVTENTTEATIGGQTTTLPFTTTDSAVQTTMEVEVNDASSTKISMPAEQVINFPAGTTEKKISIVTPIEPIEEAQLPDDPFVDEIPVVRTFGPSGTQFYPPISVTMTYTDAEIGELDEAKLTPYLFNEDTGKFDIKIPNETPSTLGCVPCVFERDPANNTITFRVDHFSTYGLGSVSAANLPVFSPTSGALLILFLLMSGMMAVVLMRRARD